MILLPRSPFAASVLLKYRLGAAVIGAAVGRKLLALDWALGALARTAARTRVRVWVLQLLQAIMGGAEAG